MAPCIKFAFERKSEKSKRKSLMRNSDWLKINLRFLIFLIYVQTQIVMQQGPVTST